MLLPKNWWIIVISCLFQTETCYMLEQKDLGLTSESLSQSLHTIEVSFANGLRQTTSEDKLNAVKGFETLSFDWVICLSKYY